MVGLNHNFISSEKKIENDQETKMFERTENGLAILEIYFAKHNKLLSSYFKPLI